MIKKTISPFGTWKVTTEGDCEGRSITDLGTYTGFIYDIALALSDKAYYTLHFSPDKNENIIGKKRGKSVNVQLDIESGTWDMTPEGRAEYFTEMFRALPGSELISAVPSSHYGAVKLVNLDYKAREKLASEVLKKLTKDERIALRQYILETERE